MNFEKENKGITLIALVISIIILLILAGISINALAGQNGILNKTIEAKEKNRVVSDLEYLRVEATSELIDYYQGNDIKSESDYILDKWSNGNNSKISVNKTDKTVTYNGNIYSMSDIIGNENEKTKINENKMEQITISTATDEKDKKILSSGKVRIIIEEENNMRAYIPNGFYYVTGKPSTGMVISDIYGDDDENTRGGNQFVWVPCSGNEGVTYEKEKGLSKTWKAKYATKSDWYISYTSDDVDVSISDNTWSDQGGNLNSVRTYGGFYIARYEAGVPTEKDFYANQDGNTYERSSKNVETGRPVSKKNNQCWNFISQKNALKISQNMYEKSQVVISSLIDSYAWDTVVEWITKDEQYQNLGNNSSSKGNFYNNSNLNLSNTLYALHRHGNHKNVNVTDYWSYATKYHKGSITSGIIYIDAISGLHYQFSDNNYDTDNFNYSVRKELATGSAKETSLKNIYDMAGNMWEWTTETGDPDGSNIIRGVLRGGSFACDGLNYSLAYRNGGSLCSWSSVEWRLSCCSLYTIDYYSQRQKRR